MSRFKKATKYEGRLKLAFIGPSGSGKTYSALRVGARLAQLYGTRMAVIDTERGSADLYSDVFSFDSMQLETFSPLAYVEAIREAEKEGYGVIVVDSLSHAWTGKEGALEQRDKYAKREKDNQFAAWRHVTPMHNLMVDALVSSTSHLIATMRTKTEYVLEADERTGKTKPRKVGLAPVQRDGLEYEFSIVGDLDRCGLTITKTRCPLLEDAYIEKPGEQLADTLHAWLRGEQRPQAPATDQASAIDVELEKATMIALIESAPDKAALDALIPQIRKLPDPPLSEVREVFRARLHQVAPPTDPDDVGTVRLPDARQGGNEGAKAALTQAMRKGAT